MEDLIYFIILGFIAQMIDGTLGMAFGIFLTTTLTFLGVPVVQASASIHFSEMFTTCASGLSHFKFKNVDMFLFKKLVIPGIIGGILGAYILSAADASFIRPFVACYLLILGIRILFKALSARFKIQKITKNLIPLGFIGGFFDAIGGGGWGPIVTTSLIAKGNSPQKTIGTVNMAEFFITVAQSATFVILIKLDYWHLIAGLIIGGILAAPIAAYLCQKVNTKLLMLVVSFVIIATNIASLIKYYHF